jgi:hypothetical protein
MRSWKTNLAAWLVASGLVFASNTVQAQDLEVSAAPMAGEPPASQEGQWIQINPAVVSLDPHNPEPNFGNPSIAIDPTHSGTIYLGTNAQGIYKSTDFGDTWAKIDTGPGSAGIDAGRTWAMAIDPFDSNSLWAASGYGAQGAWKSTDGGVSWTNMLPPKSPAVSAIATDDIYGIALDPFTPNHVLLSFHYWWHGNGDSGILESTDGGDTWIVHNPAGGWGAGNTVWFLDTSQTWLVGSQGAGLWKTVDSGQSWKQVATGDVSHGGIYALTIDPNDHHHLVLAGFGPIYQSTDNGDSWSAPGSGLAWSGYESVPTDGVNLFGQPSFPDQGDNGSAHDPYLVTPIDGSAGYIWKPLANSTAPCQNGICNGPFAWAYDAQAGMLYTANGDAGAFRMQVGGGHG